MARYIDADKVMGEIERIGGHNLCEWETIGVKALIDRQPTADVVPKGEVEGLCKEVDRLSQVVLYYDSFKADEINDVKAEVARKIFEELIDNATFIEYADGGKYLRYNAEFVAELKKKYTGEKTDAEIH